LFSLFQLLASWYLAVMYLSAIIFFITYAFVYEFKEKRSLLIYVTVTLFLVTVASLPFAFIHKDKADENGSWRTLAQCVLGSADITGCVLPPTEENRNMTIAGSLLKQFHDTPNRGENNQFLGWTVLLLFVSILYFSTKERKGFFFQSAIPWLLLAFFAFIASLGPFLWVERKLFDIKLPWFWVYYYIEPLRFMRAVSRYSLLIYFSLPIVITFGFLHLKQFTWLKSNPKRIWLCSLSLMILSGLEYYVVSPMPTYKYNEHEAVDWIAENAPNDPVVFFPFDDYVGRLLDTAPNFTPLVNGWPPGTRDPYHEWKHDILSTFPDDRSIAYLYKIGTKTIIVDNTFAQSISHDNIKLMERLKTCSIYRIVADEELDRLADSILEDEWNEFMYPETPDKFKPTSNDELVYQWTLNQGDPSNWNIPSSSFGSAQISNGILHGRVKHIYTPIVTTLPQPLLPKENHHIRVKLRVDKSIIPGEAHHSKIYWKTATAGWSEAQMLEAPQAIRDGWQIIEFLVGDHPAWNANGSITQLRFQPFALQYPGLEFEIDEIRVIGK
jgi:hypothetical protein